MTYTSFMNGDRPAAGMYMPPPEMGDVPPHWLVYFAVADVDATANRAAELGAKICAPPMDIPGVGRIAMIGSAGRCLCSYQAGDAGSVEFARQGNLRQKRQS